MTAKLTILAATIWVTAAALPQAQAPVTRANVVKVTATIQAIEATTRTLTLRDDKGNEDSFCTCSHGAGRTMSRSEAKRRFTLDDHIAATANVECRKDVNVIDETPMAYKDIDAVMAAQEDLVEIVHTLRQVVCIKG